jgi:hypothetical protein
VYLSQKEKDAATWQAQWKKAVDGTSGIAPYLAEGAEYVEDLRRDDAERLSHFAR